MNISAKKKFEKFKEGMRSVALSEGVLSGLYVSTVGTLVSIACLTSGVPVAASIIPFAFASTVGAVWTVCETAVKIKNPFTDKEKGVLKNKSYRRLKRAGAAVAGLTIAGTFAVVAVKSSAAVINEYKKNNQHQLDKKEYLSGLRKCNPIFDDCRRTFIADVKNKSSKIIVINNKQSI